MKNYLRIFALNLIFFVGNVNAASVNLGAFLPIKNDVRIVLVPHYDEAEFIVNVGDRFNVDIVLTLLAYDNFGRGVIEDFTRFNLILDFDDSVFQVASVASANVFGSEVEVLNKEINPGLVRYSEKTLSSGMGISNVTTLASIELQAIGVAKDSFMYAQGDITFVEGESGSRRGPGWFVTVVPEPNTLLLLIAGVSLLFGYKQTGRGRFTVG